MRETRPSGSEGGATEINQSFLPLSFVGSSATFGPRPAAREPFAGTVRGVILPM